MVVREVAREAAMAVGMAVPPVDAKAAAMVVAQVAGTAGASVAAPVVISEGASAEHSAGGSAATKAAVVQSRYRRHRRKSRLDRSCSPWSWCSPGTLARAWRQLESRAYSTRRRCCWLPPR